MLGSPLLGGGIVLIVLGLITTFLVVPLGLALLVLGVILLVVGLARGRGAADADTP